jgi:hypothetical protein
MVQRRYAQAGVGGEGKPAGSLRHAAIATAVERGASPLAVQTLARHASIETTLGYYRGLARGVDTGEGLVDYGEAGEGSIQPVDGLSGLQAYLLLGAHGPLCRRRGLSR